MATYEQLLPAAMAIGATVPLLLSALLRAFPARLSRVLPIGRSDFDQVAISLMIAFGLVVIIVEVGRFNVEPVAAETPALPVHADAPVAENN